jgi:hypothetical protein
MNERLTCNYPAEVDNRQALGVDRVTDVAPSHPRVGLATRTMRDVARALSEKGCHKHPIRECSIKPMTTLEGKLSKTQVFASISQHLKLSHAYNSYEGFVRGWRDTLQDLTEFRAKFELYHNCNTALFRSSSRSIFEFGNPGLESMNARQFNRGAT